MCVLVGRVAVMMEPAIRSSQGGGAKITILVVDDEPKILEMVKRFLTSSVYDVVTAANGEEALHYARTQRIDLILLDLVMPVMDGFDVLLRLKADPATIGIPVVMVTAKGDTQSIFQSQTLLARDYLVKPFDLKALLRAIARYARLPSSPEGT